MRSELRKQNTA